MALYLKDCPDGDLHNGVTAMIRENARQRLLEAAIGYFGNKEAAEKWINSPHMGLEGMTPQEMLDTGPGVEQIMDLVHQLEQGDTP